MSYFVVKMDGVEIYDPEYREMTLNNATCVTAVGEAGNMDFTFPANHVFAGVLIPYGSTIEVLEDGESVFYGRPLPPTIDIYGQKKVHCEGALAFLADVICPANAPGLSTDKDDGQYYTFLINYYNSKQTRSDRKILIGTSVPTGGVSRKREWTFRSCLDELRNNILPYTGGYVYTRRANGNTYIEWINEFSEEATQPISLGLNLVDVMRAGRQFYTAAIAKGDGVQMTDYIALGSKIQRKYGLICASLEYPAETTLAGLQSKCVSFLNAQQFSETEFTIEAVDLHAFGHHDMLKVGQVATVKVSELENTVQIPIKSIKTDLNTGVKKITVAFPTEPEVRSYIRSNTISGMQADSINAYDMQSMTIQEIESQLPDSIGISDPTGEYHYFRDENGNIIAEHLELVETVDPVTGETVQEYQPVYDKIPDTITIVPNQENPPPIAVEDPDNPGTYIIPPLTIPDPDNPGSLIPNPDVTPYQPGDTFDPGQYEIEYTYGDGSTVTVPADADSFNIPDGYTFDGTDDPDTLSYTDTLGGQTATAAIDLPVSQNLPESIVIVVQPTKTEYNDGEALNLTGMVVTAKKADGTTWTSTEYPNGHIPLGELLYEPKVLGNENAAKTFPVATSFEYGGKTFYAVRHVTDSYSGSDGLLGWDNETTGYFAYDQLFSKKSTIESLSCDAIIPYFGNEKLYWLVVSQSESTTCRLTYTFDVEKWDSYESDGTQFSDKNDWLCDPRNAAQVGTFTYDYSLYNRYVRNSKTAYYCNVYSKIKEEADIETTISHYNITLFEHVDTNVMHGFVVPDDLPVGIGDIGRVAWEALYGNTRKTIAVIGWKRPSDEKLLTARFQVTAHKEGIVS